MPIREVLTFLLVGLLATGIDFAIYQSMLLLTFLGTSPAKAIGFIFGTLFAYFANRFWTFQNPKMRTGSSFRFLLVYAIGLVINVLSNDALLILFKIEVGSIFFAFMLATLFSAISNYVGMKWYVFKHL
jgi:putative flippase GtrA